jgi:hypothetical protein
MQFRARLRLDGKTATGIEVPAEILTGLGGGKRPKVVVTINGYAYRTAVGSMGGRSLVPVSAEVRARAAVAAGDEVAVNIEPDAEPRIVTVPGDLAEALQRQPGVREAFDRLSYSRQSQYVTSIESAKTADTRQRRIDKALTELTPAR